MDAPCNLLVALLAILAADAAVELSFVSSTVAYLHSGLPARPINVTTPPRSEFASFPPTFLLSGKPADLLMNPGHVANGAAGTALVLVALLGCALFAWRGCAAAPSGLRTSIYRAWLCVQAPALALTVVALAYVFATAAAHRGQYLNLYGAEQMFYGVEQVFHGAVQTADAAPPLYPFDSWTPQSWLGAIVQQAELADAGAYDNLARHLRIARGWQFNLIALFIVQAATAAVALRDYWVQRKAGADNIELKQ